jgi:hypothetical protein
VADQTVVNPVGLIRNIKIHIHGIPYFITLTVICNTEVNDAYSMLLGHPWLIDAKVNHDWGNNGVMELSRPILTISGKDLGQNY